MFATTHWSVVLAAGDSTIPGAREALEKLCRAYWYPLYAYVRRRGHHVHEAQDLTQEFFARFLESHALRHVSREKGRFRAFLLAAMNHFLANEWKRGQTLKRGGVVSIISLDETTAEERYRLEPATELTPEIIYERRWALTLLDQVLEQLREEQVAAGNGALFDELRIFLSDAKGAMSYTEAAAKTGLSEAAARQAVRRLRQRYRELLRAEIAHTVSSPQEIDEEIRHLFAVFGDP
ncbi:MAG: RNA polymerase sigma factor [Verrucomicrobia bacterium]|nr:RNA polymerase sigma factor [Verrucomicrobiota bacterium]